MLYIIGGTSRSGKTLLSRKAVSEQGIPYFPLDALFGALANGAPEFGVNYEDSFINRSIHMWPISKHFFKKRKISLKHLVFEDFKSFTKAPDIFWCRSTILLRIVGVFFT